MADCVEKLSAGLVHLKTVGIVFLLQAPGSAPGAE